MPSVVHAVPGAIALPVPMTCGLAGVGVEAAILYPLWGISPVKGGSGMTVVMAGAGSVARGLTAVVVGSDATDGAAWMKAPPGTDGGTEDEL